MDYRLETASGCIGFTVIDKILLKLPDRISCTVEDSDDFQGIASLEHNQVVFPDGVKPKVMLGQVFPAVTEVRHLRQRRDLVTNVLLQPISGLRMMVSHIDPNVLQVVLSRTAEQDGFHALARQFALNASMSAMDCSLVRKRPSAIS